VAENLPPEPQEGTKTLRLPKSVVEKQTPLQLEVVENLPLTSFLLRKSKTMAEIKAWLQKMWSRIDHLLLTATAEVRMISYKWGVWIILCKWFFYRYD